MKPLCHFSLKMRIDRYLAALRIDPWIVIRTRLEKTAYDYNLFIFNGFLHPLEMHIFCTEWGHISNYRKAHYHL